MNRRDFFVQLAILTAVVALFVVAFQYSYALPRETFFAWMSLGFFIVFSISFYLIGYQSVLSKNKSQFISLVIGMTLVKTIACVGIAIAYRQKINEPSHLFVAMFLGIYIVYTIFETYFMMKLAHVKSHANPKAGHQK